MAPLVSPFCSPLSSTSILERAGVPAGKQSRPIAPLPYPKWTNRGPSRRAKMNGSLSPHRLASLWSSLLPMLPTLSLLFLFYLSFVLTSLYHALALRPYHRFSSFCSLRLYAFSTALLSFLRQCSPVHHVALYPILLCSLQTSRAILLLSLSLSLSLAPTFFFLSPFFL